MRSPSSICIAAAISMSVGPRTLAARQGSSSDTGSFDQTVLFASTGPLQITIATDLRTVLRDIDSLDRQEHPGTLTYTEPDGNARMLDIQVRTRGHFRRQRRNCNFPPLRVNLKKGQVPRTVFQNQDKIKLVTHCQNGRDDYEQNVLKEYLVYRLFNHLSDIGHRVRLAHITYEDTAGREDTLTRYGFFIEDEDEMATRLAGSVYDVPLPTEVMDPDLLGIVDVFQYMIGNTDWSTEGLHNIIVVRAADVFYPIPYDFDWSGFVNARYAKPDARLPIRSVRDRLYRGSCRSEEDFASIFEVFTEKRDALYGEIASVGGLSEDNQRSITEYLDDFFDTLSNPRRVRRAFMDRC